MPARTNTSARFPEPKPARRDGEMEGLPTVMIVNTALKEYDARDEFPFHVCVAVGFKSDDAKQGLPTDKEARTLESVEDGLIAAVRKSGAGHYIGNTTWNAVREFNFYVDDPQAVDERLEKMGESQHRPIQYEICEDPDWRRVDFFFNYEA